MSTPAPPPMPLGEQFTAKPTVYVDVVAPRRALVTGPASKEHPTGWSGTASRQPGQRRWYVETEGEQYVGKASSAKQAGHMLAKHHGHAPDSYSLEYDVE